MILSKFHKNWFSDDSIIMSFMIISFLICGIFFANGQNVIYDNISNLLDFFANGKNSVQREATMTKEKKQL